MNYAHYKVIKPFHLDHHGHLSPGDVVLLHARQATFLVTGGVLEAIPPAPESPPERVPELVEGAKAPDAEAAETTPSRSTNKRTKQ